MKSILLRTLFKKAIIKGKSVTETARELGISRRVAFLWRDQMGLPRRTWGRGVRKHKPERICPECRPRYEHLYPPEDRRAKDCCIHWHPKETKPL